MTLLQWIKAYTESDPAGGRVIKISTTLNDDSGVYTASDPAGGRVLKVTLVGGGGGGTSITVVANYSALPAPNTVSGKFYWCENSQGTWWLPGPLGGTYYPNGLYYSNGTTWEYMETPYQATQAEVDAGTNDDKFVTPKTLYNSVQWTTKFDVPAGTSSQYLDGTGTPKDFGSANGSILHGTASGTDTYTVTISGVTSYADGDAYLIRFTNGNTTSCTLDINGLGAIPLFRNNDGFLIGGDIWAGAEMLCVYNSTAANFQCIGTSPNSLFAYVTNAETSAITKGQVVYSFGAQGDRLTVKLANNTSDATSARTLGVVYSDTIGANQKGFILVQGEMHNLTILPTTTYSAGDTLYLGATNGSITKTKPFAPNHLVYVATVITASNGNAGRMYVRVQNGYELDELHDVSAQTPVNKDGLFFNSTTGLWTARQVAATDIDANVSNTEFSYLDGVTSSIQTQLNGKEPTITAGNVRQYYRGDKTFQNYLVIANDGTLYTNTGNTNLNLVASILIPANTYTANSVVYIKILSTKTLTNGAYSVRTYFHTSAGVGGTQMSLSSSSAATQLVMGLERTFQVLVANGTGNGTRGLTGTQNALTEMSAAAWTVQTSAIDWTQAQYLNVYLQNGSALDTSAINSIVLMRF